MKRVDALTLLLEEYSAVPAGLLSGPYFRNQVNGKTHVEFVLLGKKDGAVRELDDLRGARLIAYDDSEVQLCPRLAGGPVGRVRPWLREQRRLRVSSETPSCQRPC